MSHALRVGVADQIGYFRAYNTDGSAKTDLTSSTTGLALSVFRIGAAAVSISSLSAKAADNTAHADGAIRAVSGNLYTVDLPDAACADQVPSISVKGSYTGGVIEGPEHPLVGYNPASVAVGANTTAPATPTNVSDAQTAILAKLPAALVSGRMDSTVGAYQSGMTPLQPLVAGRQISVAATTGAVELDSAARVKLHGTQDDYAPLKSSDYTAPLTAAATRTALGMSAADLDTQLDAILAAASAGAGTGARLVTITVNDGATVLQNAVVRLTEGGNTYRALTNVSGVATFNVDDATYSVAISKVGYSYAGTTIVVNGVETATYSMTAINVTPGSGDLTTGYLTCLDELGAAEASVAVRCQLVQIPSSGTGFAYDSTVQVETSAANGLVEFPMVKGCRYLIWRGSIKPPAGIVPVLISASAGSTTALGSLIGD